MAEGPTAGMYVRLSSKFGVLETAAPTMREWHLQSHVFPFYDAKAFHIANNKILLWLLGLDCVKMISHDAKILDTKIVLLFSSGHGLQKQILHGRRIKNHFLPVCPGNNR